MKEKRVIRSERNEVKSFQNNRNKWIINLVYFMSFKICRVVWQQSSFIWKGEKSTTNFSMEKNDQEKF